LHTGASLWRRNLGRRWEVQWQCCNSRRNSPPFDSPEAIRGWLNTKNRYLGGLIPTNAVQVGHFDRVEGALEALDSGTFI
jgi:hypothetical protein